MDFSLPFSFKIKLFNLESWGNNEPDEDPEDNGIEPDPFAPKAEDPSLDDEEVMDESHDPEFE